MLLLCSRGPIIVNFLLTRSEANLLMLAFDETVDSSHLEAGRDPRHSAAYRERRAVAIEVAVRWQQSTVAAKRAPHYTELDRIAQVLGNPESLVR